MNKYFNNSPVEKVESFREIASKFMIRSNQQMHGSILFGQSKRQRIKCNRIHNYNVQYQSTSYQNHLIEYSKCKK